MSEPVSAQKYPRYAAHAPVDVVVGDDVVIRGLAMANVSRGGLFVVIDNPPPPGSRLDLKVWAGDEPLHAAARVVHVRDPATGDVTGTPPGMGLEFEDLAPSARARLDRFVDGLAKAVQDSATTSNVLKAEPPVPTVEEAACRRTPRYVAEDDVAIALGSGQTGEGTLLDISLGGAFVRSAERPAPTSDVTIMLDLGVGREALRGVVVHRREEGAAGFGLRFLALGETQKERLQRFLDGRVPVVALPDEHGQARADVADVMRTVRRLFDGIERGSSRAALGLSMHADQSEIDDALDRMAALFSAPPEAATIPQRTRVEAALRVVHKMQNRVAVEAQVRRRADADAPTRTLGHAEVKLLLEEADRYQAAGRLDDEHRVLGVVLKMAPDELHLGRSLRLRVALLESEIVARHARELLENARIYADSGLKDIALDFIRDAIVRCQRKSVFTEALQLFVRVGASRDAVRLAKDLIEADPDCIPAWQALFVLYRRHGHVALAKRAGRELVRLRPDDKQLKRLVDSL